MLTGNIQIDGKVDGTIRTTKLVTISPSGSVEGKIYADHAIINGQFEGDIYAKNVDVLANGCLKGEVTSAELTIEKGGSFLGISKTVSSDEIAEQINAERQQKKELSIVTDAHPKKTASA
ncbi:bactofilin family protein [Vibrio albus]|uniref:bactofilin family protein n=1 Tax=Vibrio albus TaxID=2200953 RepID=UPI0015E86F69|nr:polymer-forming cytoskeletal protein [Vibrio albus]